MHSHRLAASTYLGNAFNNICSHNNGVLLIEDTGWKDFENAGEDGLQLSSLLLMLFDLHSGEQVRRNSIFFPEQRHRFCNSDRLLCTSGGRMSGGRSHLFAVGCELIKEVVDDVSAHDPDTLLICELLCFPGDWHIKCQDNAKFLAALQCTAAI